MKVATYRVGGERRVGLVDERRQTVAAFDIPESEARLGALALIDRPALPGVLSPMPLRGGCSRSADPAPAPQHLLRRQELSRARPRIRRSGFDSSAPTGAVPKHPIIFSKVPDCVIAHRDPVSIDPQSLGGGRLRGRTRGDHRQGRTRHQGGQRASITSGATRSSTT